MLRIMLLCLVSFSVQAFEPCHSGSWVDAQYSGEGIDIQVLPGLGVVTGKYYTYALGDPVQTWYVFNVDLITESGKIFDVIATGEFDQRTVVEWEVGEVDLFLIDDDHLIFYYDFVLDLDLEDSPPYCLNEKCSNIFFMERLTGSC